MTQIETYERPYHVVYGEYGGDAKTVDGDEGADWPIYKARRMVVALLTAQIGKTEDEGERQALIDIREAFTDATTGEIVWGMVRRWKNRLGKTRFIGLVCRGQDYRKAGDNPNPRPGFVPSRHSTRTILDDRPEQITEAPIMTDAMRIADKMAAASRKAVESDNHGP